MWGGDIVNGAGVSTLNIDGGALSVAGGDIDVDSLALGHASGTSGSHSLSGTDTLTANREYIGEYGAGSFTQSGGVNVASYILLIGYRETGNGSYTLSGGDLSANYETIGGYGTGAFTQSGGNNTINTNLTIGATSTSSGSYNLSGGRLSAGNTFVGLGDTGIFNQTGGAHTLTNNLSLGAYATGNGAYTLSGGTLDVGGDIVNGAGVSTLNIDGGTLSVAGGDIDVDYLSLGHASGTSGSHSLSGTDTLTANREYIGEYGVGSFTQSGGNNTINANLTIGATSTGRGSYNLSGGRLSAGNTFVGLGGTGSLTQSGGAHTITNDLSLGTDATGNGAYTLSGGTLDVGGDIISGAGNSTLLINGGTLNVAGGNIDVGNFYIGRNLGSNHGSYTLRGSGTITAQTEKIGDEGGSGTLTQSGGINTITGALYIGSGYSNGGYGVYNLEGGSLVANDESIGQRGAGEFNQTAGSHTITNILLLGRYGNGSYTLSGGTLDVGGDIVNGAGVSTLNIDGGALLMSNGGTIDVDNLNIGVNGDYLVSADELVLTANRFTNNNRFAIDAGATLTANGAGLENYGSMTVNGTLGGDGVLANFGHMEANGTVGGSGGLINYGSIAAGDGFTLDNTGANSNYGNFDVAANGRLLINSASLDNRGSLRLNGGLINGSGALNNRYGGILSGSGTLNTAFNNNGGIVLVENGATSILSGFNNSGVVQLTSYSANLSGGGITNTGTIEGFGNVGNAINNTGIIEAINGTLTLSGALDNQAGGLMTAGAGAKLLITNGMTANDGIINLNGGAFDNNGRTMTNRGQISGNGILRTGGLTNEGAAIFSGGNTTVNGNVTNAAGATMEVAHDAALFTGDVVNYGTFKTTSTTVTFAGAYTENGLYYSDPSDNYFTDLIIGETGYLVGGVGDNWYVSGDFINNSLENSLWNTLDASLFLNGAGSQNLYLAGSDQGKAATGYSDNFAWGEFSLASGVSLNIFDSNADGDAAFYVGLINLSDGVDLDSLLISYISSDFNIYYNPLLAGNAYLNGQTFALNGSGFLMPSTVPVPPAVWLFGSGLLGLIAIARRRGKPKKKGDVAIIFSAGALVQVPESFDSGTLPKNSHFFSNVTKPVTFLKPRVR